MPVKASQPRPISGAKVEAGGREVGKGEGSAVRRKEKSAAADVRAGSMSEASAVGSAEGYEVCGGEVAAVDESPEGGGEGSWRSSSAENHVEDS